MERHAKHVNIWVMVSVVKKACYLKPPIVTLLPMKSALGEFNTLYINVQTGNRWVRQSV